MNKVIYLCILLTIMTFCYGRDKEYKEWETYDTLMYGTLVDFSYKYIDNGSLNFEAASINLPFLIFFLEDFSISRHIYLGTTLYSVEANTDYIDHSFLSLNLFFKLFNLKRSWSIKSELIGGGDYIFSYLYFKYEPLHITNRSSYSNPQLIKIGNETGVFIPFGSIIAGINYQYDLVNKKDGIGFEIHYRFGGPMNLPTV